MGKGIRRRVVWKRMYRFLQTRQTLIMFSSLIIALMLPSYSLAGNYDTAFGYAVDAAYIQSGTKTLIEKYTDRQMKGFYSRYYKPFVVQYDIEKEINGIVFFYKVVRQREFTIPLRNKLITIRPDYIGITISLP